MTYQALKLLGFPEGRSSDPFGTEFDHGILTSMYVALVTGVLSDIHRDRRQRARAAEPMCWNVDAEAIGRWFCQSAAREGHALCGAYEAANWMFRHLDAIFGHYAANDIVFVADGRCRDATADVIGSLEEQRNIELARRAESHLLPEIVAAA